MNNLIIMCGVSGCGKTTYSKKLLKMHPDWEYVSRDEVRYEYVTDQAHYFDHEYDVYKEFCNRITKHLIDNKTVIADATHLSKGSRSKLINSLEVKPDKVTVVIVMTDYHTCMERNALREGITRVPDQTMRNMIRAFKKPDARFEDYIDEIVYVDGAAGAK